MNGPPELTLYERAGCHLCADLVEALDALFPAGSYRLRRIDIDTDAEPVLRTLYDTEVPVLVGGGHELSRHFLDPVPVRAWLAGYNRE